MSAANLASTSNTGTPVLMDVTNVQTVANLASTSTTGIPVLIDRTNASKRYLKPIHLFYLAAFVIDFGSKDSTLVMSRVASIDGLYLTNDKDDLKFYHGRGQYGANGERYSRRVRSDGQSSPSHVVNASKSLL
ncbi:hypothetical protein TNCV_3788061 [Trichonephila clavipes]|nr:hypothetical protein TNCV_3788061 [Trichonephila clavipes]